MSVGSHSTSFVPVAGVELAATCAGLKSKEGRDLVLMAIAEGSTTVGVFTQSHFAAAPVRVARTHLAARPARYFLINSGNANAGVGDIGVDDALACCRALAEAGGVSPEAVIPFSTGVIGERLPVDRITAALAGALDDLSADDWLDAAHGIMTTDTRPKIASRVCTLAGKQVTLTGIAKGAGMIQPNMATMLAFIATDAGASKETLQGLLQHAVEKSFNRITVDSDTSTNDACMLTATGVAGVTVDADPQSRLVFADALDALCLELAQGIIRDAEGATKFVEVRVRGGRDSRQCLGVAYAIANSPLMKTALFASDANWGRIVMAIGKAPVDLETGRIDVFLGDIQLMAGGQKHPEYSEAAGSKVMAAEEVVITVDLNAGDVSESVWTCDFSHDYVRINAEYRT